MPLTWIRSSYFCLDCGSLPSTRGKTVFAYLLRASQFDAFDLFLFLLSDVLTRERLVDRREIRNSRKNKGLAERSPTYLAYIYVFFVCNLAACSTPSAFTCNECSVAFLM